MLEEMMREAAYWDLKSSISKTVNKCLRKKKDAIFTVHKVIKTLEAELGFKLELEDVSSREVESNDQTELFIEDGWRIKFPYGSFCIRMTLKKAIHLPEIMSPEELIKLLKPNLKLNTITGLNKAYIGMGLKTISFHLMNRVSDVYIVEVDYLKYKLKTLDKHEYRGFVFNIPFGIAKTYELDGGYVIMMNGSGRMAFLVQKDSKPYEYLPTKQLIKAINETFESLGRQVVNFSIIKDPISLEGFKKPKSSKYNRLDSSQMSVLKKRDDFILYIHNKNNGLYHISTKKMSKA